MNAAENLFQFLQSLKLDDGSGKSSQERLFEYCTQILGSIERFHVDFKEKNDRRDAKLSDDDKKNLAKAVSGFANSGGGVLIWGIENESIAPKPITDIQKFVASLLKLAPQTTDPVVPSIDGDWIPSNTRNPNEGFGLIYVPESSLPPHRVLLKYEGIKDHYFVRSGESFVIASHIHLEDMFGRRPHPELKFAARLERGGGSAAAVIVGLKNSGRGIAKFPFLSIAVEHPYVISEYGLDGNGRPGLPVLVQHTRTGHKESFGGSASIVVYPDSELDVTVIRFDRQHSINPMEAVPDLVIQYSMCCEGVQMQKGEERIQGDLIKELWLRKN
ncbi:MAG TPA: ATP-binding protein [Anaerolineales bacterium]|nr:ATP-binding protein [Anaerolineales bacterium]